jgi:hypothetical protein
MYPRICGLWTCETSQVGEEDRAMQMTNIPFGLSDWSKVECTEHGCSLQG